jgi:hypothetical protein
VSDLFRHIALVVAMTAALAPVAALADSLADQATISKVQASWGPGETAMSAGHYAKAVAEFQSTISYLQSIHDVLVRKCVAEGANIRIASAAAGKTFLVRYPHDLAGAKVVSNGAWRAFPSRTDCP